MDLQDFDFELPSELIAQHPAPCRDGSRLLVLPPHGPAEHHSFTDLPKFLIPGDLLVLNDTRVIRARLPLERKTGGQVEALLLRATGERTWNALLDASGRLSAGETLHARSGVAVARIVERSSDSAWTLELMIPIEDLLAQFGRAPLPPYIRRSATAKDLDRYQTVYAEHDGAVAAPTAGLHFTHEMLDRLSKTVEIVRLTLHVGFGTFRPVRSPDVRDHVMEPEWYDIPPASLEVLCRALQERRRVIAVGTTSCRTLETWARTHEPRGWTDLFILPGFEFRIVRGLVTNFHTPKSTLLMLVSALSGRERILQAYREAIARRYRFFSYGDACLLLRP